MSNTVTITVRFVVEQDFEVEVQDPKLGLGSPFAIGDMMVSSGFDPHGCLLKGENLFENPVGEIRPVAGAEHMVDANLYCNNQADAWVVKEAE